MVKRSVAGFAGVGLVCAFVLGCVDKRSPEPFSTAPAAAKPSGASDAGAGPLDLKQACTDICERSQVLKCAHADQCLTNCVAAAVGTPCNPEFKAFYRCLLNQPLQHWECAEDGVAAIREGFCDAEQERSVACMQAKAEH